MSVLDDFFTSTLHLKTNIYTFYSLDRQNRLATCFNLGNIIKRRCDMQISDFVCAPVLKSTTGRKVPTMCRRCSCKTPDIPPHAVNCAECTEVDYNANTWQWVSQWEAINAIKKLNTLCSDAINTLTLRAPILKHLYIVCLKFSVQQSHCVQYFFFNVQVVNKSGKQYYFMCCELFSFAELSRGIVFHWR